MRIVKSIAYLVGYTGLGIILLYTVTPAPSTPTIKNKVVATDEQKENTRQLYAVLRKGRTSVDDK